MASAKLTLGSLMNLISVTANTATDTIEVVAGTVNKLKVIQAEEHINDIAAHKIVYAATVADETAVFLQSIAQKRVDAQYAELYDQTMAALVAAKAKPKA